MRLLAAVAVHDELRWLPGFVENVAPRVDGIVALDDASSEGSGDYLAEQPKVLEVARSERPHPDERDRFRELWDDPGRYRVDGIWGRKWQALLWRYRRDHEMDPRPLHTHKAPMQGVRGRHFPTAGLTVFHLGMLTPEDRRRRRARFERLDPDRRWQPMGYAYLTDPAGLELEDVPPELDYRLPPTRP